MPLSVKSAKEIFLEAVDKRDPADLANYLRDACGADAELCRHVEALLRVHAEPDSLLDQQRIDPRVMIDRKGTSTPTIDQTSERPGTQIGPYKLLQQIGEGGMGVVYMAEQTEPVKRRVALKIIKPGMDTRQVIARFEAERQALSMMDHPNIAKVLDAGTTESGRPYFVMELVKGQPITQYCDEHHLDPRQRLELLLPVCQAIQHAHQKGIIHRDIKPTNILVAEYDQQPVPKVIDFGVAKATGQTLTEKTMFTGLGQIVGTLEYMSPEQAKVNQLDIDTRSDIYSLGVLLYELLTGSTPFDRKRLQSAAWDEMLRIIREEEPPKPSTRLSDSHDSLPSISAQRHTEPAKLTKLVRGELDWIVMKALEKDRNRRYETANGFAADVQRYLTDEPVQACPPSAGYRLRKFVRRNSRSLTAVALIAAALVFGVVISTWQAIRATAAEGVAQDRAKAEKEARTEAVANLQKALAAVDRFLTRMGDRDLESVPGMELVRKDLLLDAMQFYQEFLKQNSTDPILRFETAKAWMRVGNIHYWLSEYVPSEKALAEAIIGLDRLVADFPERPDYQQALADSHYALSGQQSWTGQQAKREQSLRRALGLYQDLATRYPSTPLYAGKAIQAEGSLGSMYFMTKRPVEGEKAVRTALAKAAELFRKFPEFHAQHRVDEAEAKIDLGHHLLYSGRPGEAEKLFAEAVPVMDKLAAEKPASQWPRRLQAHAHLNRGIAQRELGQLKEAKESLERALSISEKLVADFPSVPRYQDQKSSIATTLKALQKK